MKLSNLNIALLVQTPNTGQDISNKLRQLDIVSDYHRQIDELWLSIDRHRYDLLVLDSQMISEGKLKLAEHPKIKNYSIPVIIYLNSMTPVKEVIEFQNKCMCVGIIRDDLPWELQLRPLLLGMSEKRSLDIRLQRTEVKVEEYRDRVSGLIEKLETTKDFLDQHIIFYNIQEKVKENLKSMPFMSACIRALGEHLPVEAVSSFILSSSTKQLFSPGLKHSLYKELPHLYLQEDSKYGIEEASCLKAKDCVAQALGHKHVELRICGQFDKPSLILYLQMNQIDESSLPWKLLEDLLTSTYRSELLRKLNKKEDRFNVWKFLDLVQNKSILNSFSDYRVIELDLSQIEEFSLSNNHHFSWEKLRLDLDNQLRDLLGKELQLVEYSFNKLLALVPRYEANKKLHMLFDWSDHFPLWKYFSQEDLYIPNQVRIGIDYLTSLVGEKAPSTMKMEEIDSKALARKSMLPESTHWNS